jgi:Rab-like protein 5
MNQLNEIDNWVSNFPKKLKIPASMCIGFAHHVSGAKITSKAKQPKGLTSLTIYDTSIEEGNTTIGPAFEKFFN